MFSVRALPSSVWAHDASHRIYICIDLKSYYASVECVQRGLDPLTAYLLVADESHSEQTICLAVSPALKALGVPSRPRLFQAKESIRQAERRTGRKIDYIIAKPQMAAYIRCSAAIYGIYLKYIAPEDIHVYSIDEVFMDVTDYISLYRMPPHELAVTMIRSVLRCTGITATAGIGTNMYLAKVAMDIVAKKMKPDSDGVRVAELTEQSYCDILWSHMPLTDFWQIGQGTFRRLFEHGMYTMGDIAVMSQKNERLFYDLFGIDAELLIDHAWGMEPCTMAAIKSYVPQRRSLCCGQVLPKPYPFRNARLVMKEMLDELAGELAAENLVTSSITVHISYDPSNCSDPCFHGDYGYDYLGRRKPKSTHGTVRLGTDTNIPSRITKAVIAFWDAKVSRDYTVRRMFLTANRVVRESEGYYQLDLFTDPQREEKEKRLQAAVLMIRARFGANSLFRGIDLMKDARTLERNGQIGGHAM